MRSITQLCSVVVLTVFANTSANGHIVLQKKSAPRASYYAAVFKVGHGCEGIATTELIITLPGGVRLLDVPAKTGWQIDKSKTEQIRWVRDSSAAASNDEFMVDVVLPDVAGTLYWPIKQICGAVTVNWQETPNAAEPTLKLKLPAAKLDLTEK